MSPFEFIFGLFSLLLGLCMAEIFGGLGRAFERREDVTLGWLTPLLGLVVLMDLLSYWLTLWEERDVIPMNALTLFLGAMFAGTYYLAAYIVFPDNLRPKAVLDSHFFRVRRLVIGISCFAFFGLMVLEFAVTKKLDRGGFLLTSSFFAPTYAAAFIANRKWLVGSALALLILFNFAGAISHTLDPPV